MMRPFVRIVVLLVTVAITAGVVWKATINEQERGRRRLASQQYDAAAADAIYQLADLRNSLHAYVAPGQSEIFWSQRAQAQLENIRQRVQELEPAVAAANLSLSVALDNLKALVAGERRARQAVRDSQPLVAGDIIFIEARDQIEHATRNLSDARQALARAASSLEASATNEQSLLIGGVIGVWIFALILLVPVPKHAAFPPTDAAELRRDTPARSAVPLSEGAELRLHEAAAAASDAPDREDLRQDASAVPFAPDPPILSAAAAAPDAPVLQSLSALCAEIGRVSDIAELEPILGRAAELMGARGLVVWMVSAGARQLEPLVAHGYDEALIARMGTIAIDDHNVTAAAFRTEAPTSTAADESGPGAVAVPLLSPAGISGVLAAEVPADADLGRAAAVAGVIGAQLGGLFPAPAAESDEPPQHAHA
jgi:hypothetical protein